MTAEFSGLLDETLNKLMRPFSDGTARFASPVEAFTTSDCWPRILEAELHLPEHLEEADKIPMLLSVARASGYHFISAPICETLLANLVFEKAALPLSRQAASFCRFDIERIQFTSFGYQIAARATNVPWAGQAAVLAGVGEHAGQSYVMAVSASDAVIKPRRNLAGEPRDEVVVDGVISENGVVRIADEMPLFARGEFLALMRAAQMVGAMKRVAELTADYMQQREQFGKRLNQFQVLRQYFAQLVTEIAMADVAVAASARRLQKDGGGADRHIWGAIAKVLASDAADICFKLSHQLHGAMGFTAEYVLNDLSKRLLAWRDDCGSRNYWANRVGQSTTKPRDKKLWECITEL